MASDADPSLHHGPRARNRGARWAWAVARTIVVRKLHFEICPDRWPLRSTLQAVEGSLSALHVRQVLDHHNRLEVLPDMRRHIACGKWHMPPSELGVPLVDATVPTQFQNTRRPS